MKVLIHALGATMGGAERHLRSFLPQLGAASRDTSFVVLVRDVMTGVSVAPNVALEVPRFARSDSRFARVYTDVVEIPRKAKRESFDAVVSMTNFGPIWCPVPHVLFQRNSIYYCSTYYDLAPMRLRIEARARRRLAEASMARATTIVTPSDSMREMIRETCPSVRDKNFRTLYHGFDPTSANEPLAAPYRELIDRIQGPTLLYPTHPAPHKGFEILFRAMRDLRDRGIITTLITPIERADGPVFHEALEELLSELGIRDQVVFLGRVPQNQMGALYRASHLMVYPSLCESFGFSMVEALGFGLPIVAAGTGINREMCGAGALYYAPQDAHGAAHCIEQALTPAVRASLMAGGKRRLEAVDWGWRRYANDFVRIVEDAVHG